MAVVISGDLMVSKNAQTTLWDSLISAQIIHVVNNGPGIAMVAYEKDGKIITTDIIGLAQGSSCVIDTKTVRVQTGDSGPSICTVTWELIGPLRGVPA